MEQRKETRGRKKKAIDWYKVEELCAYGCTAKEIAHFLDVSHDTLERACQKEYGKTWTEQYEIWYFSKFRVSLRRRMHEKAMKGDSIMLIFMAKNHLEMSDEPQQQQVLNQTVQYSFENFFAAPQQPAPIAAPQQQALLPDLVPVQPVSVESVPQPQTQTP